MNPKAWEIGPINDRLYNWSDGYDPPVPDPHPEGWQIEISPTKQPHYLTYRHGPLTGQTRMRLKFRAEAAPGVIIHGAGEPDHPSHISLYFECPDEDGSRNLSDEGRRWWATFPGAWFYPFNGPIEHEIIAPLDGNWSSVMVATAHVYPDLFEKAKREADRVGFTFGSFTGYGHGAAATGSVKFIVTEFAVE